MKQIVIISGKGGTGKTILTASFSALAKNAVFADCDVDAADLHLLLNPTVKESYEFRSGHTAVIDEAQCVQCGRCISACRFDAISDDYIVDPISCEGCDICSYICPVKAIEMQENVTGKWFISDTRFGPLVHAKLGIAEENSGKLVTLVRENAKKIGERDNKDFVIIDGPPGIGCPVISSLSGVDLALIVTEPTLSGLHDADRVAKVARHFSVPVRLVINKYDLNMKMTERIEEYCRDNDIDVIGKITFDSSIVEAMVKAKTIIEHTEGKSKEAIQSIWEDLKQKL